MIGLQALCGYRPPVGAAAGAIRPAGEAVLCACVTRREIHSWLMDMDGVLVREESLIPGADRFIAALRRRELPFLLLTNNSIYTRRDLAARLRTSGLDVPEESIWTSALATAGFLADQRPGGSAFVIGESGLTTALHEQGYTLTERDPDYVVLGETRTYSFERITSAIRLILGGARFIATNPDPTGPSAQGPLPATGSVAALISRATGVEPYFVGKPNPLMMRSALNAIDAHSETTAMIGDRMDTDIVAGPRGRARDDPRAHRRDRARGRRALPVPPLADARVGRRAGRRAGLSRVRVAALYDIHGNLPALEAVLAEVEAAAPDLVVVGGDVVAGPLPGETLDRLAALGDRVRWVMGNADRRSSRPTTAAAARRTPRTRSTASTPGSRGSSRRRSATCWPRSSRSCAPGRRPRPGAVLPRLTAQRRGDHHRGQPRRAARRRCSTASPRRSWCCGHTHHQFDRRAHGRRLLNAGSVGMPYEDEPAAYWLLARPGAPSCGAPTTTSPRRRSACARPACPSSTSWCCARACSSRSARRRRAPLRAAPRPSPRRRNRPRAHDLAASTVSETSANDSVPPTRSTRAPRSSRRGSPGAGSRRSARRARALSSSASAPIARPSTKSAKVESSPPGSCRGGWCGAPRRAARRRRPRAWIGPMC